jgi:HEAT repeat protein
MTLLNKEKILADIREKGVEISSINDIIRIDKKYRDLIPIILTHLVEVTDISDKDWLVRCLGVKGFTEATDTLIEEFYKTTNQSLKWTIGGTLEIIQDIKSFERLLKIVQEKEHGIGRQMVTVALGKIGDTRAVPVLLDLLNDEDITAHVIWALSYFKDPKLIPYLEPYLNSKKTLVRNEAKKAIKKVGK